MKHQKYTRTKYEFAFTKNNETVFTLWLINKSMKKAVSLAAQVMEKLCKETATKDVDWQFNLDQKTIFNETAGIVGKFTGRTLFEVNGEY